MIDENTPVDLSDEIVERSVQIADEIIDGLFENSDSDFDPIAVMFNLFIASIHYLHQAGWTTQELVNEVFNHADCIDIKEPVE